MATKLGKPQPGERIRMGIKLPSNNWQREWKYGTVLRREAGSMWSLKVKWDNGKIGWVTEAAYFMENGDLEIVNSNG
jgi:hypothetical protein